MNNFKQVLIYCFFVGAFGCRNDKPLPEFIEGYVVEFKSQNVVPNAYVTTYKEIFSDIDLGASHYELVDTLRADVNGRFLIPRQKYSDIHQGCECSFVACGKGPGTSEGYVFFEDRCNMTDFNSSTKSTIYCSTQTMGYLRVFAEDIEPVAANIESVNGQVTDGGSFQCSFQIYPNPAYNNNDGVLFGPYFDGSEFTVRLMFSDSNGFIHELEQQQNVQIQGKQIVDLYFQY